MVSSTARAIVDTVRTVFVWLFFLIPSPLRVEGAEESFHVLQFFDLNKYTRTQIAKRKKEEEETEEERLFRESTQSKDAVNKPTEI